MYENFLLAEETEGPPSCVYNRCAMIVLLLISPLIVTQSPTFAVGLQILGEKKRKRGEREGRSTNRRDFLRTKDEQRRKRNASLAARLKYAKNHACSAG